MRLATCVSLHAREQVKKAHVKALRRAERQRKKARDSAAAAAAAKIVDVVVVTEVAVVEDINQ